MINLITKFCCFDAESCLGTEDSISIDFWWIWPEKALTLEKNQNDLNAGIVEPPQVFPHKSSLDYKLRKESFVIK